MPRMPDEVFALVREVVERGDFCCLERDREEKRWHIGTYSGRLKADGSREAIVVHSAPRLTAVLEHVKALPIPPPATSSPSASRSPSCAP